MAYQYQISIDISIRYHWISQPDRHQYQQISMDINIRDKYQTTTEEVTLQEPRGVILLLIMIIKSIYGIEKINTGETTSWQIFDIYNL